MPTRAPQVATVDGGALTMQNAASDDKISGVSSEMVMLVNNTTAGAVTLTLTRPGNNEDNVANPAKAYTIPVGFYRLRIFPRFRNSADSYLITLGWSATPGSTLTWAVVS